MTKYEPMSAYKLVINGRLVPGASTMKVINPATEEAVAECPRADEKQLNDAVAAAKAAFPAWSATSVQERRAKLMAIADGIEAQASELAALLTAEQGKPLGDAMGEVMGTVIMMRMLAALDLPEKKILGEDPGHIYFEHRKPLGVVAAIVPWNFPISLLIVKLTPALLAGNTLVAKPAPTTPLGSLRIGEICNRILPPGVFNIITDQNDLGALLTVHPDVAKISFTGSTATGKKVMQSASNTLKRVTLELGGNDAAIVLDDADPKVVAPKLFAAAMINSGQVCLAAKRAFIPDNLYDEMCAELKKLADSTVIGDGTKPGVQYGPIQNKMQYERVKGLIEAARKDGRIIAGGDIPTGPGYFIPPTIVRDIPDSARLVCEEQFGPVLPLLRYTDLDDAIKRANDTSYGLGGTVWSSNTKRAEEVAQRLDTGLVWINTHMMVDPRISTGGAKQSGIGQELGPEGLEEFTQRHLVVVAKG
jgi:acyl-CoA reductase-like NAD-dependent aldehyde dehydrogenase